MYNQASIYKGGGVYSLGDGESSKLPAKTLKFMFSNPSYNPISEGVGSGGTWTKITAVENNIWEWTKNSSNWDNEFKEAFRDSENEVSIVAAGDLSGISSASYLFNSNSQLISCVDLTLKNCSSIGYLFSGCLNLKNIPYLSTTSVAYCQYAFANCYKVKTGSFNMYTLLSSQQTPPINKTSCFSNCGRDTTTGAAELAQIPASWGGTAPAALNMGAPLNLNEPLSPSVIDGDDSLTK